MSDLERQIRDFKKKVAGLPLEVAKEVARIAGTELVNNTPVRTGHLKFGWRGQSGTATAEEKAGTDPSGETTKAKLLKAIASMKTGQVFYIVNPTSYGIYVEHGTSRMEARLFVAAVAAKLQRIAKQAIQNLAKGR